MTAPSRRSFLQGAAALSLAGCRRRDCPDAARGPGAPTVVPNEDEEYVWISAHANLPLFVARDHVGLRRAGEELGVKVTIAGPADVDLPGLVSAIDQVAARRPAGIMVVGWDPSALITPIDQAIADGIPVICVDADVPRSRRLCFVGTDWFDLGVRQAEAMLAALGGKRGEVALLGLIEQEVDQRAFAGFRSVAEPAGLRCLPPQQDKGTIAEAARVAAGVLQAHPQLVGMAGFDSESGPGMGQAIREAGRAGSLVATCVEAEAQHLALVEEGVLTALVAQKRALFTYYGVKVLHDLVHGRLQLTADDERAGVARIPTSINTGTYTVTKQNVAVFKKA